MRQIHWPRSIEVGFVYSLFALVLSAAASGTAAQVAAPRHAVQVTTLADGVVLRDGADRMEVRLLENGLASVHVEPDNRQTPQTPVLAPHPALHAPAAILRTQSHGIYTLATHNLRVQIALTAPHHLAFLDGAGKEILRSDNPLADARTASVNLARNDTDTLYGVHGIGLHEATGEIARNTGGTVAAGTQGNSGAPYIFTHRYGVLVDSDGGEFAASPASIRFLHASRPDVEFFVFLGQPLETMASLSRLVGPPPMPPKWTLGFLNSQWGATQAEVEKLISTYRDKRIPLDGFIFDFDWKAWGEDNYGEWRWNSTSGPGNVAPNKFPTGASGDFAKWAESQGVHLGGILKPRILTTVAGSDKPTEAAAYATAHNFWYPGQKLIPDYFSHRPARDLDFNNPELRVWYWQHLEPAFHAGMVAFWNDEADESGGVPFNNLQFLNMGRAIYEGQRAGSDLRVWTINRNFYLGATRFAYAGWSGDIDTGFANMAFQRRRMLAALNTGEFHWSMDTGGFNGHPSNENYARWMEFAAFVPIMRVHGGLDEKRQPWMYGPVAEAAATQALNLRYSLLPYIYSYERENTEGEVGLVRPLAWEFPADAQAAAEESEWMFGDALLVSPVVTEGATTQSVYLPAGDWYDYATGKHYAGGQTIQLAIDAKTWKDIPLFVHDGSIVATEPVQQYVDQLPMQEMTLDVFPATTVASFTAYDDDGKTYDYEKGSFMLQRITAERTAARTRISVAGATGHYASPLHSYLLRIHATASQLTRNGKPMRQESREEFQHGADGWAQSSDKFGSVILVRVPAGSASSTTLTLRY
jgi:alpha-glucosidase